MEPKYIVMLVIGVILILIIWYISTCNKFKRALIKIEESLSGIDVGLAKRYNILTNMVEVVKGYAKHEQETLLKIVKLRDNMTIKEKADLNESMDRCSKNIGILVEDYPELKASENFKTLQLSIIDVEEHLQAARRLYNSNISIYNQMVSLFPSNLVAKILKMENKDYFEASSAEKENVKIDL